MSREKSTDTVDNKSPALSIETKAFDIVCDSMFFESLLKNILFMLLNKTANLELMPDPYSSEERAIIYVQGVPVLSDTDPMVVEYLKSPLSGLQALLFFSDANQQELDDVYDDDDDSDDETT